MRDYTVTLKSNTNKQLLDHLLQTYDQEDLCFATYLPSEGMKKTNAILQEIIFPRPDERHLHGNVAFTAEYLERALEYAGQSHTGLVLLHSHLGPGWQSMSDDDVVAEKRIAPAALSVTGFPLIGMTAGTDGAWSARFWHKDTVERRTYNRAWCLSVKVVGQKLSVTFNDRILPDRIDLERQLRTISSWGQQKQRDLSKMTVGIVGLGSVGSMVAEILARTGITRFILIDFDSVEYKNLDRLTNVFNEDVGQSKVSVIRKAIVRSSSSGEVEVREVEYSICEEKGYRAALDCDVLFSCVDRPWPRQILNYLAYAHLIPVIDGGILVRTNEGNTKMKGADWRSHLVGFGHECLECMGQFSSENAKLEREGFIDDPSYMQNWQGPAVDHHENVFVFGSHLASFLVLRFLHYVIAPSGVSDPGKQMYHFVTGSLDVEINKECKSNCFFTEKIGLADYSGVTVYSKHLVAEAKRLERFRTLNQTND